MERVGGSGANKNQERHGGTTALTQQLPVTLQCLSSVFLRHDSEIGIPGEVSPGGERERRKGSRYSGRGGENERGDKMLKNMKSALDWESGNRIRSWF